MTYLKIVSGRSLVNIDTINVFTLWIDTLSWCNDYLSPSRCTYKDVIAGQLQNSVPADIAQEFIIAYEPVWAIGTGKVPTNADIEEVFNLIREGLGSFSNIDAATVSILYGGSANGGNCEELSAIPGLGGYLVGSASLKPDEFTKLINSLA